MWSHRAGTHLHCNAQCGASVWSKTIDHRNDVLEREYPISCNNIFYHFKFKYLRKGADDRIFDLSHGGRLRQQVHQQQST